MKKQYYLVLDVETANSTDDALVYDIGYSVRDRQNNEYDRKSFIVSDIFHDEAELMKSAYYAKKIPQYLEGIHKGEFQVVSFYKIRQELVKVIKQFPGIKVCAYNAHFDTTALNKTYRWLTKSKYRWFLPYGTEIYDIWHMACQVICTMKSYKQYCYDNKLVSSAGNIKTSAEAVFGFISKNPDFDEKHTGLQDVLIEAEILNQCFRKHKKMNKGINRLCWRIPQGA